MCESPPLEVSCQIYREKASYRFTLGETPDNMDFNRSRFYMFQVQCDVFQHKKEKKRKTFQNKSKIVRLLQWVFLSFFTFKKKSKFL